MERKSISSTIPSRVWYPISKWLTLAKHICAHQVNVSNWFLIALKDLLLCRFDLHISCSEFFLFLLHCKDIEDFLRDVLENLRRTSENFSIGFLQQFHLSLDRKKICSSSKKKKECDQEFLRKWIFVIFQITLKERKEWWEWSATERERRKKMKPLWKTKVVMKEFRHRFQLNRKDHICRMSNNESNETILEDCEEWMLLSFVLYSVVEKWKEIRNDIQHIHLLSIDREIPSPVLQTINRIILCVEEQIFSTLHYHNTNSLKSLSKRFDDRWNLEVSNESNRSRRRHFVCWCARRDLDEDWDCQRKENNPMDRRESFSEILHNLDRSQINNVVSLWEDEDIVDWIDPTGRLHFLLPH